MARFKFYRKKGMKKGWSMLWTRDHKKALRAMRQAERQGYKSRIIPTRTYSGKKAGTDIWRVWRWKPKKRRK